jgi:hypothetical protein
VQFCMILSCAVTCRTLNLASNQLSGAIPDSISVLRFRPSPYAYSPNVVLCFNNLTANDSPDTSAISGWVHF